MTPEYFAPSDPDRQPAGTGQRMHRRLEAGGLQTLTVWPQPKGEALVLLSVQRSDSLRDQPESTWTAPLVHVNLEAIDERRLGRIFEHCLACRFRRAS